MIAPPRVVIRRDAGLYAFEQALRRRGFPIIVGADEAGRGACAGPLVAAAVALPASTQLAVADSKVLNATQREEHYQQITEVALSWATAVVSAEEVDQYGLHVCNVRALRQAIGCLSVRPDYVLTDGFPVAGVGAPALAVWKGDQVAASVAAASIVAKVTRDRLMTQLDDVYPRYRFARHKGYPTAEHTDALVRYGPCPVHRYRYANVRAAISAVRERDARLAATPDVR